MVWLNCLTSVDVSVSFPVLAPVANRKTVPRVRCRGGGKFEKHLRCVGAVWELLLKNQSNKPFDLNSGDVWQADRFNSINNNPVKHQWRDFIMSDTPLVGCSGHYFISYSHKKSPKPH